MSFKLKYQKHAALVDRRKAQVKLLYLQLGYCHGKHGYSGPRIKEEHARQVMVR
jgi:hypothetical protein